MAVAASTAVRISVLSFCVGVVCGGVLWNKTRKAIKKCVEKYF